MGIELKSSDYDNLYNRLEVYDRHYTESPYYRLWQYLISYIPKDSQIVDLGCGTGQVAEMLSDLKYKNYLGIDFSEVAIQKAKKRLENTDYVFMKADLKTCPIPKADYYLIIEVLEHIGNELELIGKLTGNIIASVPDYDSMGHVRLFNNLAEVRRRYENVMDITQLGRIKINYGTIYFIIGNRDGNKRYGE